MLARRNDGSGTFDFTGRKMGKRQKTGDVEESESKSARTRLSTEEEVELSSVDDAAGGGRLDSAREKADGKRKGLRAGAGAQGVLCFRTTRKIVRGSRSFHSAGNPPPTHTHM